MTVEIHRTGINTLRLVKDDEHSMATIDLGRDDVESLLEDVRPSSSGTIINARDFSDSTADTLRDRWDGGKLRAVLHALPEGKRVNIVTDTQTGHTLFNVELIRVTGPVSMHNGPEDRLTIRYHHHVGDKAPGYHETSYSAHKLGAITVPAESTVKWDALKFWRDECSAAMYVARAVAEEKHGQNYGKWSMHLSRDGVFVKYEPQRPEAGPIGYGHVAGGQLTSWSTYGGYEGPHGSYRDLEV